MSWIKVIVFNILITFSLLGMLLLTPPIVYFVYSMTWGYVKHLGTTDDRASLHIYNDIPWADRHFYEFSRLTTTYYDFITWRRDNFSGETINISDGLRTTIVPQIQKNDISEYYFFGGSTTWGTGVNDANTYQSLFAERIQTQAYNFGETDYIARQSLAFLSNFLIQNSLSDLSGRHIVFYDGVNDVSNLCRSENSGLATSREKQVQQHLLSLSTSNEKFSFGQLFDQLTQFLQAVTLRLRAQSSTFFAENAFSCSTNSERAEEVAKILVETWQIASDLVTQRGGTFTAILQPVAYIGNPHVTYLNLTNGQDLALGMQFKAVYPLIRQFAKAKNINFVDLSFVYDGCDNCYIDYCHVGPQAHQILVESLAQKLLK